MAAFKLNSTQIAKAISWLEGKTSQEMRCPVCSQRKFSVQEELTEMKPFQGGNLIVGGPVYLYIAVACNNCAHTLFFNALLTGVISQLDLKPATPTKDPFAQL